MDDEPYLSSTGRAGRPGQKGRTVQKSKSDPGTEGASVHCDAGLRRLSALTPRVEGSSMRARLNAPPVCPGGRRLLWGGLP